MLANPSMSSGFPARVLAAVRCLVMAAALLGAAWACPPPAYAGDGCKEQISATLTALEAETAGDLGLQASVFARAVFYADAVGCIPVEAYERLKSTLVDTDPLPMTFELIDVQIAIDECVLEGGMTPDEAAAANKRVERLEALAGVLTDQMFAYCAFLEAIPPCE